MFKYNYVFFLNQGTGGSDKDRILTGWVLILKSYKIYTLLTDFLPKLSNCLW